MTTIASTLSGPSARPRIQREPVISSPVLAVIFAIATEIMFFAALISALMVIRASSPNWAPPGNILLPMGATAFNTAVLLASGICMAVAGVPLKRRNDWKSAKRWSSAALLLGAFFVIFQGVEWSKLIAYGLTMQSGVFGGTFYLLIGSHAIHVIGALIAMVWVNRKMSKGTCSIHGFQAMQLFWTFVVLVWPVLYRLVYFGA